ncbi:hypothetical protein AA14337_2954 [Acetobacter malorum DSM 14337]|uniref:Uncharacterized protein n=1 Tax=Acetobacter malorum DSM 14337 TaxID=1307910 RepID=A0ABQ0PYU4_9PROT|nr:hypothetical protein [Acetobacter malorum]GBQ84945.1 hypothetical protein AA14337_2954 [Acetobacter malorum DSM 14337]
MSSQISREDFKWRHDTQTGAMVVVRNDRVYGEIIPWTDKDSGNLTGFTGNIIPPNGSMKEFMPSEGFCTPLDKAKEEVVTEICRILEQVVGSVSPDSSMTTAPKADSNPKAASPCGVVEVMKVMRSVMDVAGMTIAERREALAGLLAEVNATS